MGAKDGGKKPGSGFDNYYKSLIIYMVVMLVVTILLNGLIVPSMTKRQISEVGYNDFLDMVESGRWSGYRRIRKKFYFWPRTNGETSRCIRPACGMIRI